MLTEGLLYYSGTLVKMKTGWCGHINYSYTQIHKSARVNRN